MDSGIRSTIMLFGGVDLFGGPDGPVSLDDTWTWNGAAWIEQNVTGPIARSWASSASLGGVVVMFGGNDKLIPGGYVGDTWVWDGSSWVERNVTGPGASSTDGAMARLGGALMIFGGGGAPGDEADIRTTWTWNGEVWAQQSVLGPSARRHATAATLGSDVVLFGGGEQVISDGGLQFPVLGDTWTWDGTSWTQRHVSGPSARAYSAAATLNDTVVLFGGTDANFADELGDTWTWDGTTWTHQNVSGPSPRDSHAMATLNGLVILFGGFDGKGGELGDTWAWNGSSWTQLNVDGPSERGGATMAGP